MKVWVPVTAIDQDVIEENHNIATEKALDDRVH